MCPAAMCAVEYEQDFLAKLCYSVRQKCYVLCFIYLN